MATLFRKESFDRNYTEVCKFIGKDGKLRLGQKNPGERYLANWLNRQYKRKQLTDEQREKLEHLKAHFDPRPRREKEEEIWNENLKALIKYKEEYHTIKIQKRDIEHKRLYKWCNHQKTLEKTGGLTMERKKQLMDIGFEFVPAPPPRVKRFYRKQEMKWEAMYNEMKCFKERHGHCQVRFHDSENQQLAKWVMHQRVIHNQGTFDVVREQKLNEIGFIWKVNSKKMSSTGWSPEESSSDSKVPAIKKSESSPIPPMKGLC